MMHEALPKKVLATAHENGIHNDCLAASELCAQCWEVVVRAIDHHYAKYGSPAKAAEAYIEDLTVEAK